MTFLECRPPEPTVGTGKQQGSALLLMLTSLVMVFSGFLLDALNNNRSTSRAQGITAKVLARSKQALIAYAGSGQPPGFLPCPDMDLSGDGLADPPCGPAEGTAVGWLPWRQLGLPPLRDGSGSLLWYAVAGNRKQNGHKQNGDSQRDLSQDLSQNLSQKRGGGGDNLRLASPSPTENLAAVLIAPGRPVAGQIRNHPFFAPMDWRNAYLEGTNRPQTTDPNERVFESFSGSPRANDHLLVIAGKELPRLPGKGHDHEE